MSSTETSSASHGQLHQGQVKWYSIAQGYGFLSADAADELPKTADASHDIFVHHSVVGDDESLVPGERVLFAVEAGPKGLLATRLERLE